MVDTISLHGNFSVVEGNHCNKTMSHIMTKGYKKKLNQILEEELKDGNAQLILI